MPYARWGMTNAAAATLTGVTEASLTDAVMTAAEDEIVDFLGWDPDPDDYDEADGTFTHRPALAFGRAVAWQAAYRTGTAADAQDGGGGAVKSESIAGDYSVTYGGDGRADAPIIAPRVRLILLRHGWVAGGRTGATSAGKAAPTAQDFQTG